MLMLSLGASVGQLVYDTHSTASPREFRPQQHNPPHRPAGTVDARHQLDLPCPTAAAVVAHPGDDLTERQVAPRRVRLGQYAVLSAAVAGDPQEP